MKNYLVHNLIKFLFLFFISITIHAGGNESDSLLMESLDEVLIEEYKPCSDQSDISSLEVNTISSLMIVSEGSFFTEGEVITSSSGVQAIVDSYNVETKKLTFHQSANTGFETFLLGEKIIGSSSGLATVKEFIIDLTIPCSELIVSIEEEPQQMIFTPKESAEEAKSAAAAAAAEMMAEIEEELAREAALEAFQQKLAKEKAAAARSTEIYQARVQQEQMIKDRQAQLALERELAEFEAKLEKELAFQEWYANFLENKAAEEALEKELAAFEAQLEEELLNQAALAEFLARLAEEMSAAAASTAAYHAKVAYDARVAKIKEDLVRQLEEVVEPDDYKSHLVEELIAQATAKLEEEKFIGAISGEIVTVAIHEFCQDTLNLSDSNIVLFKKALAGGYLGNVGPQVKYGTEFTVNRWDKYITCVGSLSD